MLAGGTSSAEATPSYIDMGSFVPVSADAASARRQTSTARVSGGAVNITLNPYAVVCVDGS
jgi:hypothetical protein